MNPARIEEIISAMTGTDVRIDDIMAKIDLRYLHLFRHW